MPHHPISSSWKVHKFGGTSLGSAERFAQVVEILSSTVTSEGRVEAPYNRAVVVSAMSKVTDALIATVDLARSRDDVYLTRLEELRSRHVETIQALGLGTRGEILMNRIASDIQDLQDLLKGVRLARAASWQTIELVSGYGELWSAQILHALLQKKWGDTKVQWLDAREVLRVSTTATQVQVEWPESRTALDQWMVTHSAPWVVVTGYIASTLTGETTTLKRNGSDYSASIFGAMLKAESIVIWTDVDGVLSADPRLVPDAVVLPELSYREATELAYFGAKVVHPSTMAPAIEGRIPIWIKNTFRPDLPGTCIHAMDALESGELSAKAVSSSVASDAAPVIQSGPVRGFSTVDAVALLNVEGTGMVGVPGVAERLFGGLRSVGVSVILISQASSEQSICFAIPKDQAALAQQTLEKIFFAELHQRQIQRIAVDTECSILAAVGDAMVATPGVAGRFLSALGQASVSVRAIAQGASERNISVVVARAQAVRALRAVHAAFLLSPTTLAIGVIGGSGGVGATLLQQIESTRARLLERSHVDLRVLGVLNSQEMELRPVGSNTKSDTTSDASSKKRMLPGHMKDFMDYVQSMGAPHAVLIDCTASAEVAKNYADFMAAGFHVITPNKKAGTAPWSEYLAVRQAQKKHRKHYLYETTVGAALPVLSTLRDLVETGDEVARVEAVLSGTLSFLFNTWDGEAPFSSIVKVAHAKGYTEPDPRDDLSGMDVARKLVILAREMGWALDLAQVQVESLADISDEEWRHKSAAAKSRGHCLRFVGVLEPTQKQATAKLVEYLPDHPFARLQGADNCFLFQTARYADRPLVIQGPGAGRAITSGGVFADLLRLSAFLGAVR